MRLISACRSKLVLGLIPIILVVVWVKLKPVESQTLPDPNVCYAIATDDEPQHLLTFNLSTGQVVDLGSTGTGPDNTTGIESLAYDRSNGNLYAVDNTTLGGSGTTSYPPGTLGTLSKTSATWTAVSGNNIGQADRGPCDDPVNFDRIDGLATDPGGGYLWAVRHVSSNGGCGGNRDRLLRINPSTGQHVNNAFGTNLDYLEIGRDRDGIENHTEDIVMDIDGTLYAVTNETETGDSELITINTSTGVATQLCEFSIGSNDDVEGITIANDGTMYISTGNSSSNPNRIYRVDNRTTCAVTLMSSISFGSHIDIEDIACPVYPTQVDLTKFEATRYGNRVLLQWQTGYEVDNLGFRVYREEGGQLKSLNHSLVAGSALLAGPRTTLTAGFVYTWWDDLPKSTLSAQYWLEDVDLKGNRTRHGPITPAMSERPPPGLGNAPLLSRLGRSPTQTGFAALPYEQELAPPLEEQGSDRWQAASGRAFRLATASSQLNQARMDKQWELAAQSAIKISVRTPGWYRLRQPELVAAGFDPGTNPRFLQLYTDGAQVPITVVGEEDERLDPEDAIEFYGLGLDTPWTDTRIYWLVRGSQPGDRIKILSDQGGWPNLARSFPFTVERRDRTIYFPNLKNGEEDNFFGPAVETEPVDQILRLQQVDLSSSHDATLEVSLQGVTDASAHRIQIRLNGTEVGEALFNGQTRKVVKIVIPQSRLREGDNIVTFVPAGGEQDVSLVDYVRLTYWHTYTADGDMLWFTAAGGQQITIGGFSCPQIKVLDVTNPQAVQVLTGLVRQRGESFAVTVYTPQLGQRKFFAFTEDQIGQPAEVKRNQPSTWHGGEHTGEVVMITHRDFLSSLLPLKSLRESQGWSVVVVDVEDVYDEFNFGAKSPWAIKDFLARAEAVWQERPRFVVLVGDASFDPRNYLGLGDADFVPTKLVATDFLETASDDWFVDFDNDERPDLAVGRLPVRTAEETARVVTKLITYERTEDTDGWTRRVLLVADANEGFNFEAASVGLRAFLPADMSVEEVFSGQTGARAARSRLLEAIQQGQLIVNYIGHGSVELWRGDLLTSSDARGLTNGQRLPLIVAMTCLNGLFHDLYTESLAESLMRAERGGAVAVWASSGLTYPFDQVVMNEELFRLIAGQRSLTLGEATAQAKRAIASSDVRRTWILFGDPVTTLR